MAQLLLDEVDGLTRSQPEGRGGVAQVVEANGGGEACVLEREVVPAAADVVAVQHEAFGAPEDELLQPAFGNLGLDLIAWEYVRIICGFCS